MNNWPKYSSKLVRFLGGFWGKKIVFRRVDIIYIRWYTFYVSEGCSFNYRNTKKVNYPKGWGTKLEGLKPQGDGCQLPKRSRRILCPFGFLNGFFYGWRILCMPHFLDGKWGFFIEKK